MPSINAIFQYPFDNTGLANTNKVTAEQHTVNSVNGYRDYQLVVPRWAPFFENDVRLRFVHNTTPANNRDLVFGVDYIFTHRFVTASKACAKPVFGSILLLNPNMEGIVVIDNYQTIGGEWTIDETQILEILANVIHNPRLTSWESVNNIPYYFPVQDHDWRVEDMVGMSDVVNSIAAIEDAIRQSSGGSINTHVQDLQNPHQVTKAQVLLGNVMNYPMATTIIAEAGTSLAHYMSPAMSKALIVKETAIFRDHLAIITGNPHGTTAAMVNAYTKVEVDDIIEDLRNTGLAASDTIRFDGKTAEEYRDWVLSNGIDNAQKFAGRDWDTAFEEIRANIPIMNVSGAVSQTDFDQGMLGKLGTGEAAADTRLFDSRNSDDYKDWVLEGTADLSKNTQAFGERTPDDYKAWVLEGTAADTDKIFGMNVSAAMDWIETITSDGASAFKYLPFESPGPHSGVWTYLGGYRARADVNLGSFSFLLGGGDTETDIAGGLYSVTISHTDPENPEFRIVSLNTSSNDSVGFCYTESQEEIIQEDSSIVTVNVYKIYLVTGPNPLGIDISRISYGNGHIPELSTLEQLIIEPNDATYLDIEVAGSSKMFIYDRSVTTPSDAGSGLIASLAFYEGSFIKGTIIANTAIAGENYCQQVDYSVTIDQNGVPVINTTNTGRHDKLSIVAYVRSGVIIDIYLLWGSYMLKTAYHFVYGKAEGVSVEDVMLIAPTQGTKVLEKQKPSTGGGQIVGLGTLEYDYSDLGPNVGPMSLIQVMVVDPDSPSNDPVWFDALNFCSIARNQLGLRITNDTEVDLDIEIIVR